MNRVVTLSIALFVAIVAMSLANTASACHLFRHWGGHHHGCCHQTVQHDCGGCNHGCGHSHGCGGCGHHGGCGNYGGGYGGGCCDQGGGQVIEQGPVNGGGDVPEAPPAVQDQGAPKETSIRSNRIFRTASFRR